MKKISSENLNFLLCGILGTLIICILLFNITNKFSNTSSKRDASDSRNKVTEKEEKDNQTSNPNKGSNEQSSLIEPTPVPTPIPTKNPITPTVPTTPNVPINPPTRGSEMDLVNFFEQETNAIETYNENDMTLREKAKNTFTTIIDFLFYGKEVKGYTFKELTNSAKLKVISLALKADNKIDQYFPNYKDKVKDKYTSFKGKLAILYLEVTQSLCETVGDATCNQAKEDFENMKNSFGFTWSLLKELGNSGKEKLSEFYLNWRNS